MSLRERNRVETRAELVRAAMELFLAEGFDSVPVERICERASVSRATFFNYFSQKEEVLVEIGRQRLDRLERFLAAQEAWQQTPTIEALVELFVEFARDNEEVGRMGRHVMRRALATVAVAAQMSELMNTLRARVAVYLSKLSKSKKGGAGQSRVDAAVLAENVVAVYFWSTIEWTLLPDPRPGELARNMKRRMEALFRTFPRPRNAARGTR